MIVLVLLGLVYMPFIPYVFYHTSPATMHEIGWHMAIMCLMAGALLISCMIMREVHGCK
ncbi:hypothetical protein GXY_08689 [Novacetimonas hansenii ATCC 23769]|uniref:Uncharacterized protein n=1 Tax=Novacetimonas hansenii ATCC 23769 TaxID=714995 RepID=D5QF22_NOVHA|nr:hypothetical protein GXY_08689 [Novacetimonas hansenii ATCC 23769]